MYFVYKKIYNILAALHKMIDNILSPVKKSGHLLLQKAVSFP
jgi:hypothetical protein